ncbi:MAG: EutN/CcmL family microcompartment protein [Angelakisella sp.]
MMICKVIGHVWATKKEDTLNGLKLMVVREEQTNVKSGATFVAADVVGAGIGEQVLVVSGSTARRALGKDELAVDCAIVGIIDSLEVDRANNVKPAGKAPKV